MLFGNSPKLALMQDLLKGLNSRQQEAVLEKDGPILILAGPGSGKTRVLTHRVAYLLQKGVSPENILAVTFTNKAAEEMRTRIGALIHGQQSATRSSPFIGTFHSLAAKILRTHAAQIGYAKNFTILDEDDSLSLIKEALNELEVNPKQFPAATVSSTISRLKSELLTPEKYAEQAGLADFFPKNIHKIYTWYARRLREANAMDFDDLLLNACLLFERYPAILFPYQDRFRYINIDEYQDVNTTQYVLITKLAQKHRNIAAVGDDAQAIYGWRNADYRNILNFAKDWPDAKIVILDQNYRSTQVILDAARKVISQNSAQKDKALWTEKVGGEPIGVIVTEDERKEAERVMEEIKNLLGQGYALTDMAVLYRTNSQSRALEETFLEQNFPYKIIGGVRFYQRKEIKDILAYLKVLINPADILSLKRIINIPPRGIGKVAFLKYLALRDNLNSSANSPALKNFLLLTEKLKTELKKGAAANFIQRLLETIKYHEYLETGFPNAEERWENVEEFLSLAEKYAELEPPAGLEKLLEDTALMSETDEAADDKEKGVTLLTLHAAKGLEFRAVFIVGMEEGIFPHARSLFSPTELEEERRLCYVGLTRAKERVFLSFALRRSRFGSTQANPPSRFLSEIPENLIKVQGNEVLEEITLED